ETDMSPRAALSLVYEGQESGRHCSHIRDNKREFRSSRESILSTRT
ncbi:13924_t:CDS:1, partial [Acaulospora colombiana]